MKRLLGSVLFLAACTTSHAPADGAVRDMSVPVDAGRDLAMAHDAAPVDLMLADAEGCLASTPPTQLYEDVCPGGGTICFIDHPPTDFF